MPARKSASGVSRTTSSGKPASISSRATNQTWSSTTASDESLASIAEQLVNRVIRPLDLVLLTRERIQETLDEVAERGRITRSDANELLDELVRRGGRQTDEIVRDLELLFERGRDQLELATRTARLAEPVERLVRGADRVRITVGVGPSFPIVGYDELTAAQVCDRLAGLRPAQLRAVRDYERRHANRKSVLAAVEKSLA